MAVELLHLPDLLRGLRLDERRFYEFQRSTDLSSGVYVIPAGQADHQSPHDEDEVYYVVQGRATARVGEATHPVTPGTFLFVPAKAPHRFEGIEETLVLLVVFGPAYRSRSHNAK